MDFRKTYSGPGRSGDEFAQLGKDTRQERDDRRESGGLGNKGLSRPTQSSIAKHAGDRLLRSSVSSRTGMVGRYGSLSHSIDLGPALRAAGAIGSGIPRQPQASPSPLPPSAAAAVATDLRNAQLRLQDLVDAGHAGHQRETLLLEQKRHLEASLRTANMCRAEAEREMHTTSAELEMERKNMARLRAECDDMAAELEHARSQAAQLEASGSVALTTSEVCRVALSTAFKGTVSAIGNVHQELESALASREQADHELQISQARVEELEQAHANQERELEARATKIAELQAAAVAHKQTVEASRPGTMQLKSAAAGLEQELELRSARVAELESSTAAQAQQLQAGLVRNAELEAMVTAQERELQLRAARMSELETTTRGQERDMQISQARAMELEAGMKRIRVEMEEMAQKLCGSEDALVALMGVLAPKGATPYDPLQPHDIAVAWARGLKDRVQQLGNRLEFQNAELQRLRGATAGYEGQVTKLKEERDHLEGDNLQLAAESEQLRRDADGLRNKLEEVLLTAAILTAATDREASAATEVGRVKKLAEDLTTQVNDWRQRADAAQADAEVAWAARDEAAAARERLEEATQQLTAAGSGAGDTLQRAEEAERAAEEALAQLEEACGVAEAAKRDLQAERARSEEACAAADEARVLADEALARAREAHARAEEATRSQEATAECVEALEAEAGAQAARIRELEAETARFHSREQDLREQVQAERRASEVATEQRDVAQAYERVLLQRIQSMEAERQQLLRRIDDINGELAKSRQRLEDLSQQAVEAAELRIRAMETVESTASATVRLATQESELLELRAALRESADRASKETRLAERREQQLAALRQQAEEAEDLQRQAEAEMRVLKTQVSENTRLRARVDELSADLSRASSPKPSAKASTKASADGSSCSGDDAAVDADEVTVVLPAFIPALQPPPSLPLPIAVAHAAVARQQRVASWLAGGPPVSPNSLLEMHNMIREEYEGSELETGLHSARRAHQGAFRPLRLLVGLLLKGTLVAGGVAAGLALGNTQTLRTLAGGSNSNVAGKPERREPCSSVALGGGLVMVEGIPLPPQSSTGVEHQQQAV